MTKIRRSALMDYSAESMFDLVNDIESYADFLPGCASSKILESGEHWVSAELKMRKDMLQTTLRTRNECSPPHSIQMMQLQGPFKSFSGLWGFKALSATASKVELEIDFELQYLWKLWVNDALINKAADHIMDVFCRRAKAVRCQN